MIYLIRESTTKNLISLADTVYPTIYKMVLRPMIGRQLDSMNEMEDFLTKQCQDIDYTIVRPPRLLDAPLKGKFNRI